MPASSGEPAQPSRRCSSASASPHAADRRVGTYSKGMRQRLGLAQALLGEPRVLLLDEPTTGLDPALRHSFYEIVEELRGRGATVLLSSHALTELEERAGRVVIMNRGVKVADGTLDELRRIARLPTRIRLTVTDAGLANVPNWLGPVDGWRRINGHMVEIDAAPERKIEVLRRATDEGAPVEDLDVVPPTLDELYAHFLRVAGGRAMRNILIVARKEIQEGLRNRWVLATTLLLAALALSLTFLGSAPTGTVGVARARRGDRQPLQPDDLPAAADRAADLARRHRRRDGARHHAAAAELPGGALAGAARQVRRPPVDPRLRDAAGLRRGRGRACWRPARRSTRRAGRPSPP